MVKEALTYQSVDYNPCDGEMQRVETCSLCGECVFNEIEHVDRYGFEVSTAVCMSCGFCFLNPRPTNSEYSRFYREHYRPLVSAYHGRLINASTIQSEQKDYAANVVRVAGDVLQGRDKNSLLDIGGSTGVVSRELQGKFGLAPTVLDPAPDELIIATESGMESIPALAEDWDPTGRRFDVVGIFQTLDHMLDPISVMRTARNVMPDTGVLIADIVDVRYLIHRNRSVSRSVKVDHPSNFSEHTAELMLRQTGFRVRKKAVSPDHVHVLYVATPDTVVDQSDSYGDYAERFCQEVRMVQADEASENSIDSQCGGAA